LYLFALKEILPTSFPSIIFFQLFDHHELADHGAFICNSNISNFRSSRWNTGANQAQVIKNSKKLTAVFTHTQGGQNTDDEIGKLTYGNEVAIVKGSPVVAGVFDDITALFHTFDHK
jgi:hypothetical protein